MGLKCNKVKKIAITLSIALVFAILGMIFLNKGDSGDNVVDSNKALDSEKNIENDIPPDPTRKKGINNQEVLVRYDKVDKNSLTYDIYDNPHTRDLEDPYFHELENGLTLDIEVNRPFTAISDKKYGHVLAGYSLSNLDEDMTREDALYKANLVLPEDCKEIKVTSNEESEFIHYSSEKESFIVHLAYKRIFNEDKTWTGVNKDRFESISYFKAI